jgi:hypothetical protein
MKNILLILLVLISLSSCRVRKVDKSEIKKEDKVELTDNSTASVKSVDSSKTIIENKTNAVEDLSQKAVILEPLAKDKPIEVVDNEGKKTSYYNAKVKFESNSNKKNTSSETKIVEEKNLKKDSLSKKDLNLKKESNENANLKKVDAKPQIFIFSFWFWLLLIAIALIWYFRKKIPILQNFF